MSYRNNMPQVKDLEAYSEGFQKGIQLIESHKKLLSVSASFIKSFLSKNYNTSYHIGISDGWDFGFKKEKEKLQDQAAHHFAARQAEQEKQTQSFQKRSQRQNNTQPPQPPLSDEEKQKRFTERQVHAKQTQQRQAGKEQDGFEVER